MEKKIKVGMFGLGTVGMGVAELFQSEKNKVKEMTAVEAELVKVYVRNVSVKQDSADKYHLSLVTTPEDIINDPDIQIVIEVIGGIETAKMLVESSLNTGKHVITANKDLMAQYGDELTQLAEHNGVSLFYEASVAGGIPILRTVANSFSAEKINSIYGIVNGTTNFMLNKMSEENKTYAEVLKEAQTLGFAEQNPKNDVEGIDAAFKMAILTKFAYGMTIPMTDIQRQGITDVTPEDIQSAQGLGYVLKLIGSAKKMTTGIYVDVAPVMVPHDHPLANVKGAMNAVFINSTGIGESMFYGPGAGSLPTAASILSDVATVIRNIKINEAGLAFNTYATELKIAAADDVSDKYYFSMTVPDTAGVFKELADLMAKNGISFKQIQQKPISHCKAQVILTTHDITMTQRDTILAVFKSTPSIELQSVYKVL
ncbi:homoserine dehydrogenase [Vagococcus vulneris]|uniref:Homoserine dehydrogenase n=1 Tax=Vagococcus vulneris TaxID=1977869 RepID=A0A430A1U3_9ENTE|nr:homoserine dehydrogenase [Vagococcus vulneris]RSU00443.1 homoserine dehydrogenase [Vagococcus vulneris]